MLVSGAERHADLAPACFTSRDINPDQHAALVRRTAASNDSLRWQQAKSWKPDLRQIVLGFPIHNSCGLRLQGFQLLGFCYKSPDPPVNLY